MYDLLIKGGLVIDGTGTDGVQADVAVRDGRICDVGRLDGAQARKTVDAAGKVVTPGFIDSHSHADLTVVRFPDMENLTAQGVTTICAGQCGMGVAPLGKWYMSTMGDSQAVERVIAPLLHPPVPQLEAVVLDAGEARKAFWDAYGARLDWSGWGEFTGHLRREGIGPNMMTLVGHGNLRVQAMGPDCLRVATDREIDTMVDLLTQCMEEGACGLSFGFDYVPSSYAREEEILALASVVARYDGLVSAHVQHSGLRRGMRDPEFQPYQGFQEFLEIGRKTGVRLQISHLRTPFKPLSDREAASAAEQALMSLIARYRQMGVRVGWDVLPNYPVAGEYAPMLASLFLPYVERCGSLTRFGEMLGKEPYWKRLLREVGDGSALGPNSLLAAPDWDDMWVVTSHSDPSIPGHTLRQLAQAAGCSPVSMALELLRGDVRTCGRLQVKQKEYIGFADFAHEPDASVGLDVSGCPFDCNMERRPDMPPVYLGSYSDFAGMILFLTHPDLADLRREDKIAALTGRTARNLGLKDRGLVQAGMRADLLVIDWDALDPNIDYIHPNTAPKGLEQVYVNGVLTVEGGIPLNPRAGQVIDNSDRLRSECG